MTQISVQNVTDMGAVDGLARMGDDDCWRFLAKHAIGRVAIVHHGSPLVFPVNYALDDRSVVFRTAPGTKLALAATGSKTVFEVDDAFDVLETGASVMVHGSLELVSDPGERARLSRLGLRAWAPGHRDFFVRVNADRVTGRRIVTHSLADGLGADAG
jgi:nitroimidazol reductase NimA-like FMN-containing flavoprotein (pyridoxamine 5'-phosphate oxidase superfamily)